MENFFAGTSNGSPTISLARAIALGREYGDLMVVGTPTEADEQRMDEILELATIYDTVDFWVSYEGCIRGMEMELVSESAMQSYEDQKARLREYLGMTKAGDASQRNAFNDHALTMLEIELREQIIALQEKEQAALAQIFRAAKV